jgi:hypothetical protein
MAKYKLSRRIAADADAVVARMSDPREQEAILLHYGARKAESRRVEAGKGRVRLETRVEDPPRFIGEKDESLLRLEWDLAARVCTFVREDLTHGDRVKVRGTVRVEPAGKGACVMHDEGEILIGIPVVGGQVAKQIVAMMDKQHADRCAYWEARAKA